MTKKAIEGVKAVGWILVSGFLTGLAYKAGMEVWDKAKTIYADKAEERKRRESHDKKGYFRIRVVK